MAETLTEVLREVRRKHVGAGRPVRADGGGFGFALVCLCGWAVETGEGAAEEHAEHVDAHLADAVRAWLLDREQVEAAARCRWPSYDDDPADVQEQMRRHVTDGLTALTEADQ